MDVLAPYDQMWDKNNHYIMLKSGRDAGKSTALAQLIFTYFVSYEFDIIVSRSNYGDLFKSMFTEIMVIIEQEHFLPFIEERKKPLKIINKLNGNIIHFEGIGGADLSRSKGLKTKKKVSLIVLDEAQQLPSEDNLQQAMATFRRHLDEENWKIIYAFNPERQRGHWCNEMFRIHQSLDNWLCLETSYKDIAKYLTRVDLEAIQLEKEINPDNYRYLYLGETKGLFGGVYTTFNRDFHLIKETQIRKMIREIGIFSLLIGVDGATTVDKTAFVPAIILNNGQALILNIFYHDPVKNGAISNDQLFPYVDRWLDELQTRWGISRMLRVEMIFDSANADLRLVFDRRLPSRFVCVAYTQKNIIQMADIMKNAFSRNVVYILDETIFNYVTNRAEYNTNPLVEQLESVMWHENGKVFDSKIPNDCTDALTYAIAFYFRNPDALYFPKRNDYYERRE